jgi:hypothetical protein
LPKSRQSAAQGSSNAMCSGMMSIMGMMTIMGSNLYKQHTEGWLVFMKTELKHPGTAMEWVRHRHSRDNVGTMIEMYESMMMLDDSRTTLSERLQFEDKTMAEHLASLKRIERALAGLYAVFNDEQKTVAKRKRLPLIQ